MRESIRKNRYANAADNPTPAVRAFLRTSAHYLGLSDPPVAQETLLQLNLHHLACHAVASPLGASG